MNPDFLADKLNDRINRLMTHSQPPQNDDPLMELAAALCLLPKRSFRERLREDLLARAEEMSNAVESRDIPFPGPDSEFAPNLAQREFTVIPGDPRSFLFSFLSHAAAVVLIASGIWAGPHLITKTKVLSSQLSYLPMPLGTDVPHGGGSGGDHSIVPATRGTPPKFSDEQLASPAIVVKNETAKLQVQPTVLGPPQIRFPQSKPLGDLMSPNLVIPSNGTGSKAGMGSNSGTGVGSGMDAGVGTGSIAGYGGDAFRPGNGVSAPRALYDPDPEYSDEARRAKYQGNVVLSLVVDPSGHARNIHIVRSVGMGLDEKAIEAVQKWRFAPGTKDGHAVAVLVNVEVNFRLY